MGVGWWCGGRGVGGGSWRDFWIDEVLLLYHRSVVRCEFIGNK